MQVSSKEFSSVELLHIITSNERVLHNAKPAAWALDSGVDRSVRPDAQKGARMAQGTRRDHMAHKLHVPGHKNTGSSD